VLPECVCGRRIFDTVTYSGQGLTGDGFGGYDLA
jgi:hypothetical protein